MFESNIEYAHVGLATILDEFIAHTNDCALPSRLRI